MTSTDFNFQVSTKLLVKKILENPHVYNWSYQGLGMLRLYLSTALRMHVWDTRVAVPNVTNMHDHPWDFESYIVAGMIYQKRYREINPETTRLVPKQQYAKFMTSTLHCGAGNCALTDPVPIILSEQPLETYGEHDVYRQDANEIHWSTPEPGTVTLVHRTFSREDVDHARVFWPDGEEWVSAEPRPATTQEVSEITSYALNKWFSMQ